MSLKTCKLLQTIAIILFTLALVFTIASIPLKNTLIRLAYADQLAADANAEPAAARAVPTISIITAAVHFGIAIIHIAALKKNNKQYILTTVVACSLLFFLFKLISPAVNNYVSNRVMAQNAENAPGVFNTYAMLENTVYGLITLLLVPGSILMFLSFGGSIGKGDAEFDEASASESAGSEDKAANADAPAEKAADSAAEAEASREKTDLKKKLQLIGLDEPEPTAADGENTPNFMRPEAYREAFKKPEDTE